MARKKLQWSPDSTDPACMANNRVCLVLLRIYRSVPLSRDELDLHEIIIPFWSLIREEPRHLRGALLSQSGTRRAVSAREKRKDNLLPDWVGSVLSRQPIPEESPDMDVLHQLAEGLVFDRPAFRPLFDAVESRLEKLVSTQRSPADKNISLLTTLLRLSPIERELLAIANAIEAGTVGSSPFVRFARPSRQVQALVAGLQLAADHEVRDFLSSHSQLRRSGLMSREGAFQTDLEEALRLTRQGSALVGTAVRSLEDMAAVVLKQLPAGKAKIPLTWPHLEARGSMLQALLARSLEGEERGINILFYGVPGTGKTEYASHLIAKIGAQGYSITDADQTEASASRNERLASLGLTQIFSPVGRSVLVLDEAEDIFQADYNNPLGRVFGKKEGSKSWMNSLLESNEKPVIWISNQVGHIDPAYLRRFTYCLEFPTTPRGVRRAIAHAHLDPVGCSAELVDSLASHESVSPALLASAARFTQLVGARGQDADAAAGYLLTDNLKAMGQEVTSALPPRATRFDTAYLNIKGLIQPESVIGGLQRQGKGTLLLSGPPGTGKTQLAAEIALRLGRELVYRTASDINTMWFGESERNVARMFAQCDAASEVLFLDEADTLLASREADGHRANVAVAAEFLRHIEAFAGVFVCATNHSARLDAAMIRRFSFRLEFLPLSLAQRQQLLCEVALQWNPAGGAPQPALDPRVVSRLSRLDQLTPGDFANVAKRVNALGISLDTAQWVDELDAEHGAKPNVTRSSIGFI